MTTPANIKGPKKKGQIAILLAMSFSLLFILIAMVVNISFLVTAKINLQNAVDLAAYAGAAQQARYLTEIGKWNYEMRRNYKAMIFDYLITYNAERKNTDFKDYINNNVTGGGGSGQNTMEPIACAALQRRGSGATTPPTIGNLEQMCTAIPYDQFQDVINNMASAAMGACGAMTTECTAGGPNCASYTTMCNSAYSSVAESFQTAGEYSNKYFNYSTDKFNYNLRLLAWMIHAHRHLQTRIRGVHYGDLSIADRLTLVKASPAKIVRFLNSPIGVAAKVINGFNDPGPPVPTLQAQNGVIELNQEAAQNPMHNAALTTFRNNLLKVINNNNARIFHIMPTAPVTAGFAQSDMASGCQGGNITCSEYSGPYLRLQQHDVNMTLRYMTIVNPTTGGGKISIGNSPVNNIPVGVLKDNRVWTYYAVAGVARTDAIPFKVFFGGGQTSDSPYMIAVAAARPFGSRIGPFIDDNCENMSEDKPACEANGRDPLYPITTPTSAVYPNFSIVEKSKDPKRLGVKLAVDRNEAALPQMGPMQSNNPTYKVDLYAKTYGGGSRNRLYTRPGAPSKDDGFDSASSESDYYENMLVPPMGNRNSIFAWPANASVSATAPDANKRDGFEGYFEKFEGRAIYSFGLDNELQNTRVDNNSQDYRVRVFKYPLYSPAKNAWEDSSNLTAQDASNYMNSMERAFMNAMAVNEFEIKRYIIPYSAAKTLYLNNITSAANNRSYIYGGETLRDGPVGTGNKPFGDSTGTSGGYAMNENQGEDALSSTGIFPESYTAWRTGSRGYRVKLVNIQDLRKSNEDGQANPLSNPLPDSVELQLEDEKISIDLKKVNY